MGKSGSKQKQAAASVPVETPVTIEFAPQFNIGERVVVMGRSGVVTWVGGAGLPFAKVIWDDTGAESHPIGIEHLALQVVPDDDLVAQQATWAGNDAEVGLAAEVREQVAARDHAAKANAALKARAAELEQVLRERGEPAPELPPLPEIPEAWSAAADGTLKYFKLARGKVEGGPFREKYSMTALFWTGDYVFAGCDDGMIRVYESPTAELLHVMEGHESQVTCLFVHGSRLYSASADCTAKEWNATTGECLRSFVGHDKQVTAVARNGDLVFTGSDDGCVIVWNMKTGYISHKWRAHLGTIRDIFVTDTALFTAAEDHTVRHWEPGTGECIRTLRGHSAGVTAVREHDGFLISGSHDGSVKKWALADEVDAIDTFPGPTKIHSLSTFRSKVYAACEDGAVREYTLNASKTVRAFNVHETKAVAVATRSTRPCEFVIACPARAA